MQLSTNVVYYTKSRVYFSQKTLYKLGMIYLSMIIGKNIAQKYTKAVFTSIYGRKTRDKSLVIVF